MKTALVTGGAGLLGGYLARALSAGGFAVHLTAHRTPVSVAGCPSIGLDLTDRRTVEAAVEDVSPAVIVHTAAITDVDHCQTHRDEAWRVNVCGTQYLSRAAASAGAFFIYVSTDHVFDGATGNYRETDRPAPANWYGLTKLVGELAASRCLPEADIAIVRTSFYGPRRDGRGFFGRCLAALGAGQGLEAADDLFSSPLPVTVLAKAMVELAGRRLAGIHHIAGADRSSRYEFALAVAKVYGLDASLVRPRPAKDLNLPGPRPRDVSLCVRQAQERLRVRLPTLVNGLEEMAVSGTVTEGTVTEGAATEGAGDGAGR